MSPRSFTVEIFPEKARIWAKIAEFLDSERVWEPCPGVTNALSGSVGSMASLLLTEAATRAADITVTGMAVTLDLTGPETFTSTATIDFHSTTPATFVDFKGRHLVSADLNGVPIDVATWADGRLPLTNLGPHNRLVVTGIMEFSSDGEGLHRHVDSDGHAYVYGMSFLDAAPRWFACFDQPDLKAPYHFDIVAPDGWTVWGNGPSQHLDGHWLIEQQHPLATYFVTLAAGPWAVAERQHDGIPLTVLARQSLATELEREADNILDITAASFDAYHEMFTIRYPYGGYVQAFVPDFNAGAMENPGCVTFRDQFLLRGRPTRRERAQRAGVIAHEMAHQWFGDLVTMRWWDDLWLNESFAEYMGHRVIVERTDDDLWTQFGIDRKDWGSVADQGPSTHPVAVNGAADAQSALANFDGISYAKGAALLRQMATAMGDSVFLNGLNAYFEAHQHRNASFADLMAAWTGAGADIDAFSDEWLCTSGMDKISVAEDGATLVIEHGRSGVAERAGVPLEVAALDGDGAELARQKVSGAMPGTHQLESPPAATAVVVPDAGDLCWAKLRPSTWGLPPIARIADPATRVVLHNALRDAVRDADLPPAHALRLLSAGLTDEPSDDILAAMTGFAVELASLWSPWGARAERLVGVAEMIEHLAATSTGGGDRQMILAKAWVRCTGDTAALTSWLTSSPDGVWAGLEPDPDLRWATATRLVALGADTALIDAELAADPLGVDKAAGAQAAAPIADAKRDALTVLLQPSDRRAYELYAIAEQIWQIGQEELCEPFVAEWFAHIGDTTHFRSGWALARVARASFPLLLASANTLELAQTAFGSATDDRLRRELADSTALLARLVKQH